MYPERFLSRFYGLFAKGGEAECWPWLGKFAGQGYGVIYNCETRPYKRLSAHRVAYAVAYGEAPAEMHIHHVCGNRACVNPKHLIALPPSAHSLYHARLRPPHIVDQTKRTHCKYGHPFTPENTYVTKDGRRVCRTCKREWAARHFIPIPDAELLKGAPGHCPHGHPYPQFARYRPNKSKYCVECMRLRARRRAASLKAGI